MCKAFRFLTAILLLTVLLAIPFISVAEHNAWQCPECGRNGNLGNYCGNCAHPAPWLDQSTPQAKVTPVPNNMKGANNEKLSWNLSDGILLISGKGEMADYAYNGAPWYDLRDQIFSIIIDEGITTIGKYAFFECNNLQSITMPTSLKRINDNAFMYCYTLPTLTIPEGVQYIGESIIYRNPSLTEINLPSSLIAIGGSFAGECPNLRTITVAQGNRKFKVVDGVLFDQNMQELICHPAGLTDIQYDIPSGVKTLGVYAFAANRNLIYVTIPNTVTTIDSCAFTECSNLESVTLPSSVKRLGIYAFCDCSNLTSITLSDNITSIDQQAFSRCYKLEEIILPKKLTNIGNFVFLDSSNLTKVYIPAAVKSISDNAFEGCPDVTIYGDAGSYAQKYAKKVNIPFTNGKIN